MKILKGKELKEIYDYTLNNLLTGYESIVVDLGTGNGDFVYRNAKENPNSFYIGIDSSKESLKEYSLKINKKVSKGGLYNVLYVIANAEELPLELTGLADKIYINLPWGSLRDGLIKGEEPILNNIKMIGKNQSVVNVSVTYSEEHEANELMKRNLPNLSYEYFTKTLKSNYRNYGFEIKKVNVWDNSNIRSLNTKWANKLSFGKKRTFYNYSFSINK